MYLGGCSVAYMRPVLGLAGKAAATRRFLVTRTVLASFILACAAPTPSSAQTFGGAGGSGASGGAYGNSGADGAGAGGGGVGAPGGNSGPGSGGAPGSPGQNGIVSGPEALGDGGGGGGGLTAQTTASTSFTVDSNLTGGNAGNGGGNSSSNFGGGGGAGGFGFYAAASDAAVVVNAGIAVAAGAGGSGGMAASCAGKAGSGGGGGFGVYLGAGGSLVNSGSISGAAGGNGGTNIAPCSSVGSAGGAGGHGVSGDDLVITNGASGSIAGGNGGAGGAYGAPGDRGSNGAAGSGIYGANLTIINSGLITGALAGDGVTRGDAITFAGDANKLTLDPGSSLVGDIGILGSSTTATFTQTNADAVLSNAITGAGNVIVDDGGSGHVLTLAGTNSYTGTTDVESGKLVVNGSIGSSSSVTVESGATLGGSGIVSNLILNSGSTLATGNSIGTLNAASATFNAGMAFEVEVNGAGTSDLLNVAGTTTINGGTVVVVPDPDFAVSTPYTIITSGSGVTGKFSEVEFTAGSLFLRALLSYDTNNVYLTINPASFVDVAATSNQRGAATAAESLGPGNPICDAIFGLTTTERARQAYDALSGEIHASVAGVLIEDSRYVRDAVFARLLQASYGGSGTSSMAVANAPAMAGRMALGASAKDHNSLPPANDLAFWAQAYGAWGSIDGNGNAATVDRTLGGFITGVDANIGSGWRAGVATGYARSDLSVDARLSSGSIDSYQLAGYLGGRLGDFALRGGGAWTWSNIDAGRTIAFAGFVDQTGASYHGDTGQIFGEIALPLTYAAAAWEPFARLTYVNVDTDGFAESGGPAALTSAGTNTSLGYSTLGVRVATTTRLAGARLTPHASLAWQHAIGDIDPAQTLAFASGGTAFAVLGAPLAGDSALIDAGLTLTVGPDATLGVAYSGQLAGDVVDNAITGRFDWRF